MLGVWTTSGSSSPAGTTFGASAIVTFAAEHIIGPKFRVVLRYTRFPQVSAFHAQTSAKSAWSGSSSRYSRPPSTRVSLPSATLVPTPVAV
jgi:hypothetical protein